MLLSPAVIIRNLLDKPEHSLKRDLAFTDSTSGKVNMKKQKTKDIYGLVQREYLKFFSFSSTILTCSYI